MSTAHSVLLPAICGKMIVGSFPPSSCQEPWTSSLPSPPHATTTCIPIIHFTLSLAEEGQPKPTFPLIPNHNSDQLLHGQTMRNNREKGRWVSQLHVSCIHTKVIGRMWSVDFWSDTISAKRNRNPTPKTPPKKQRRPNPKRKYIHWPTCEDSIKRPPVTWKLKNDAN